MAILFVKKHVVLKVFNIICINIQYIILESATVGCFFARVAINSNRN